MLRSPVPDLSRTPFRGLPPRPHLARPEILTNGLAKLSLRATSAAPPALQVVVEPSELRDAEGNVVEVVG